MTLNLPRSSIILLEGVWRNKILLSQCLPYGTSFSIFTFLTIAKYIFKCRVSDAFQTFICAKRPLACLPRTHLCCSAKFRKLPKRPKTSSLQWHKVLSDPSFTCWYFSALMRNVMTATRKRMTDAAPLANSSMTTCALVGLQLCSVYLEANTGKADNL